MCLTGTSVGPESIIVHEVHYRSESDDTMNAASGRDAQKRFGTGLRRFPARIEQNDRLDSAAESLVAIADRAFSKPMLEGLRGRWLGHSLHPLLTDFPLGAWMSASLLDVLDVDAHSNASERLLSFGLAVAFPTMAAGLAEAAHAPLKARRVALVHATMNGLVTVFYGCSLLAHRRRALGTARAFSVSGGILATVSGYLGGHLSLVLGIGVEAAGSEHRNPSDTGSVE
jgi:uncharacterized membrane protein